MEALMTDQPKKITLNIVDDDGKVVASRELEVQPMPENWKFEPLPVPEPSPGMSEAEGFFLEHLWLEMLTAAQELHPDYRQNEHGMWQRFDPVSGQWLHESAAEMKALVAWLETKYPLKVRAIEHDLRAWMRDHDMDI
jgi:hypothetical protein